MFSPIGWIQSFLLTVFNIMRQGIFFFFFFVWEWCMDLGERNQAYLGGWYMSEYKKGTVGPWWRYVLLSVILVKVRESELPQRISLLWPRWRPSLQLRAFSEDSSLTAVDGWSQFVNTQYSENCLAVLLTDICRLHQRVCQILAVFILSLQQSPPTRNYK